MRNAFIIKMLANACERLFLFPPSISLTSFHAEFSMKPEMLPRFIRVDRRGKGLEMKNKTKIDQQSTPWPGSGGGEGYYVLPTYLRRTRTMFNGEDWEGKVTPSSSTTSSGGRGFEYFIICWLSK
jgi:hypothetical protein